MKCTRCSADLPAQAKFCLQCGTPVAAVQPPAQSFGTSAPESAPAFARPPVNTTTRTAIGLLLLAVAALSAIVVHGSLTHAPVNTASDSLVNAPRQSASSGLVQAPGEGQSGNPLQAPGSAQAPPTPDQRTDTSENVADIEDYLRFLKEIEAARKELSHSEDSHLKTLMTTMSVNQGREGLRGTDDGSAAGDPKVKNLLPDKGNYIDQIHVDWQALSKRFVSREPPRACIDLRNKYLDQLGKTEAELAGVFGLFETMSADPSAALQKAYDMQGKSQDIDEGLAASDDALAEVCRKHGLSKDFSIRDADSSSGLGGLLKGFTGM